MSLATEKKLINSNYVPIISTSSNIVYKKKFDETTEYSIKKQNTKYKVTFPLSNSTKAYTTTFDSKKDAQEYLYDIVEETIV